MENIKTIGTTLSALALGLTLAACSGSGKAPTTQTGQLVDAAVQGANYKATPSGLSGVTDANGNYSYQTGDKVVFSFGNIVFPEVDATGTVTPLTLAGTTDINNQIVVNIARFLQSLDDNGNPDDGIVIDPAKVAGIAQLDFTKDTDNFEIAFKAAFPTDSLVTITDAVTHLQEELDALNVETTEEESTVEPLPDALAGQSFDLYAGSNTQDSPYFDGQQLTFAISAEGVMTINEVASQNFKSSPSMSSVSITMDTYEKVGEEYKWTDTSGGFSYTASLFEGSLNEINVNKVSDGAFAAQFTTTNPCNARKSAAAKSSAAALSCGPT